MTPFLMAENPAAVRYLLPLSVFLYASFFRGLTTEYEEAAVIEPRMALNQAP